MRPGRAAERAEIFLQVRRNERPCSQQGGEIHGYPRSCRVRYVMLLLPLEYRSYGNPTRHPDVPRNSRRILGRYILFCCCVALATDRRLRLPIQFPSALNKFLASFLKTAVASDVMMHPLARLAAAWLPRVAGIKANLFHLRGPFSVVVTAPWRMDRHRTTLR